jgi:hypothetical protein
MQKVPHSSPTLPSIQTSNMFFQNLLYWSAHKVTIVKMPIFKLGFNIVWRSSLNLALLILMHVLLLQVPGETCYHWNIFSQKILLPKLEATSAGQS